MLWTIVRRELLDHLISLRFALLSILTLLLLTANGLVFSGEQRAAAVSRYNSDVRKADEELEQRCSVGPAVFSFAWPVAISTFPVASKGERTAATAGAAKNSTIPGTCPGI